MMLIGSEHHGPREPAKITSTTLVAWQGGASPRSTQIHHHLRRGRAIVLGDRYLRREQVRVWAAEPRLVRSLKADQPQRPAGDDHPTSPVAVRAQPCTADNARRVHTFGSLASGHGRRRLRPMSASRQKRTRWGDGEDTSKISRPRFAVARADMPSWSRFVPTSGSCTQKNGVIRSTT
jgi:hypothetical protein